MRCLVALGFTLALLAPAPAAVVVLANFTPEKITCTVAEGKEKPQTVVIPRAQVVSVIVGGPCDVSFPAKPARASLRLDPYHAYVFMPDQKAERRLHGIAMPGAPLERDQRPAANPPPRDRVKVPVTLLVDDADPRADALWHKMLRKRFDEAAAVLEANIPVKLEFQGFATWRAEPGVKDMGELFDEFSKAVKVKAGSLAIGYTSRIKVDPKEPQHLIPFGAVKPFPFRHILLRESGPRSDPEKVEAMLQNLGLAFGAILIDPEKDGGTVMRARIANGLALHPQYRFRFDPLNVLAMNIWVEEMRRGPIGQPSEATQATKLRLSRVYKALLKERPGDANALAYLDEFERGMAKIPMPKKGVEPEPAPVPKVETPGASLTAARDNVARHVVRAITARARANKGPSALTGDALTKELLKAASIAAWKEAGLNADQDQRVSGFLFGIGIALDDTSALLKDPATSDEVKSIELEADRIERLEVLGNPTIRGRRDLCRRFAIGCGSGEILPTLSQAEELALERSFSRHALARPAGVNFSALAAELAGIEFTRLAHQDNIHIRRLAGETAPPALLPSLENLRDGISPQRFHDDFGDTGDPRFLKALGQIRDRIKRR